MNPPNLIPEQFISAEVKEQAGGIQINFKRVLDRALGFWYFFVISLVIAFFIAFMTNRYSQRIYPVSASIIIKENEENVGAKFLYNNELLNPYRNFYNEIFIMRSYSLLQEVIEDLGFDVSFYREGEIMTTEYYDRNFPVKFHILPTSQKPYGISMYFEVHDDESFSLQYVTAEKTHTGKEFSALHFNDTIKINGYSMALVAKGDLDELIGKTFVVRFNDPLALARDYSSRLNIGYAQLGAAVVNLEINGSVPQKEVDFLNKFIERYQQFDVEKKNTVATMAMSFLDQQLRVIGDSLKLYEDQVEQFKQRNVITDMTQETNRLNSKIQAYEEERLQYKLTENYYDYITGLLKNDQYEGIFTPASVGVTDAIVATLINEAIELQTQVKIYQNNKKRGAELVSENPKFKEGLLRIGYLKGDILKAIENSRKTQEINNRFMNDQIQLIHRQLAKLPGSERELISIKRNYSLKETLYIFLLQKRTEAGLSEASTTSDIMVVNPPNAGGSIAPKVRQNYGFAAGAGLLIPTLIFVLMEILNNRIQSKDDIERVTSVPLIGAVGHNAASEPLIVLNRPRSGISEAFRALRSNLNYFTGNKDHQIFIVASSVPGEGKSFTALNLASVFSLAGKRTIIVGADLRKPKLYDDLNLKNECGLSQYLSGMAGLDEIIQKSAVENLFLISGGPMPPNPSELLIKPAMEHLLSELRKQFDFVIIDTPPLSLVTDAFVLAPFADHTLFLIRQNYTPMIALNALQDYYSTGKLTKISVLFNDLQKSGLGYGYGYNYGYGYGYGYGDGYFKRRKRTSSGGYYSD